MKEINSDITIIGSGLIGLLTAHALLSLNHNIVIVDKKTPTNKNMSLDDNRTVAISEGSKQFLEKLLLWKELQRYSEPIKKIEVFDRSPINKISFKNPNTKNNLGYVIRNSKFIEILANKLNKKKKIKTFYDSEVIKITPKNNTSKVYFHDKTIKTKLVIAADGKNSAVRKIFNNKTYKKKYLESALVLNFFHEKKINNTAYEIFYKTGPLAVLPMKSSKKMPQSSVIWSNEDKFIQKLFRASDRLTLNIIEEKIFSITGKIIKINSKQRFPLSAHINNRFINNRLVYIGDSAHSIHPIAGQGWNLGVKDVKNLSYVCELFNSNSLEIGSDAFLKKYSELCYNNTFQLYQITDKLNSHFKKTGSFYRFLNNTAFKIIDNNENLKNKITKYAMGI